MQSAPKVTLYITNHNYGRFIEQAIESVLRQSMQDFELIIIDDGSTDHSREIIERYVGHPKIVPIFQQNKGLNVSNNIALRAARGRYIMRLDADDWLDENALSVMAGALDRDRDLGLVFPDYYMVDEAGHVLELVRRHDFQDVTLMDQPAHGACTLIRRKCLLELGGYDESLRCQDGYDLWIRFIAHHRVRNINLPLFYYRQHGTSLTKNERRILDARARIIERHSKMGDVPAHATAIIPVRGKVLDPASPALEILGGRPLIDWTIEAALEARHIRYVLVTSPDPDVLAHVDARFGTAVFTVRRQPRLALPNTRLTDTLVDALDKLVAEHEETDVLALLQIESPFRNAGHIDTAIEILALFNTDSVVAVRSENDRFFRHDGSGLVPVRRTPELRLEREELYREAGGLHIVRTAFLRDQHTILGGRLGHVVLDQKAAIVIRSDFDWQVAGLIADAENQPRPLALVQAGS